MATLWGATLTLSTGFTRVGTRCIRNEKALKNLLDEVKTRAERDWTKVLIIILGPGKWKKWFFCISFHLVTMISSNLWNCVWVLKYFPYLKETQTHFRKYKLFIDSIPLLLNETIYQKYFFSISRVTKLISELLFPLITCRTQVAARVFTSSRGNFYFILQGYSKRHNFLVCKYCLLI